MHEDEGLDCKVLSVMMRHFKKYLQIFSFSLFSHDFVGCGHVIFHSVLHL